MTIHSERMLTTFFPVLYVVAVLLLLWQAFRVIRRSFGFEQIPRKIPKNQKESNQDRTGLVTIHPELLDQEGRITEEELLTVRFSGDNEPPHSATE